MDEEEQRKREYLEFRKVFEKDFLVIYRGRMKRSDFLFWNFGLNGFFKIIEKFETPQNADLFLFCFYLPLGYVFFNFVCKRVRDIGFSAWFATLPILASLIGGGLYELRNDPDFDIDPNIVLLTVAIAALFFIPLYFWPSQKRDNKYGRYYPYGYLFGYKPLKKPMPEKQKPQKKRAL